MFPLSRLFAALALLVGGAVLSGATCVPQPAVVSGLFDPSHRIVLPRTAGTIVIDGVGPSVAGAGDAAWTNDAAHYRMEDGGPSAAATMRVLSDDTNAYFYFETEDATYESSDAVVLALNPSATGGAGHKFVIYPCQLTSGGVCPGSGGSVAGGLSPIVSYATGDATSWTGATVPAGVEVRSNVAPGGAASRWSVELKLPRTALGGLPEANWFGLSAVIVASRGSGGTPEFSAVQYSWPSDRYLGATPDEGDVFGDIESAYLPASQWGNATLSTAFGNGVSALYVEFGSGQTNPNQISLNAPNLFYATALNNSSSGGQLVAAQGVSARFTIANNGLPALGSWANVPGSPNPVGPRDLAPATAERYESLWTLNPTQRAQYTANPSQCVRATLLSTDPATVIVQPTVMRNMTFVTTSSPFRADAMLSTRGLEKLVPGSDGAIILRERVTGMDGLEWRTRIEGATQIGERLWRAPIPAGADRNVRIEVTPDERLRVTPRVVSVPAGAGGRVEAASLEVEPGSIITLIAEGSVDLGGLSVSASGITPPTMMAAGRVNLNDAAASTTRAVPNALEDSAVNRERSARIVRPGAVNADRGKLREGLPERYGALIGSFDGFRTSFVLGATSTFQVPANARRLELAINDGEAGYALQRGEGFKVSAIATRLTPELLGLYPELSRRGSDRPIFIPLGANLPNWIGRGEIVTSRRLIIAGQPYTVHAPAGSFGYQIRETR